LFPDLKRIQQMIRAPMCGFTGASCPVSADESVILFHGLFIHETLFKTRCARKQGPARVGSSSLKPFSEKARRELGRRAVCATALSPMKRFSGAPGSRVDVLQRFPCRQKLRAAMAQTSLMAWPR
jgi:hypothetical protein